MDKDEEGRSTDEIEITDAMSHAGVAVLAAFPYFAFCSPQVDELLDCADDIYRGMVRAKDRGDPSV